MVRDLLLQLLLLASEEVVLDKLEEKAEIWLVRICCGLLWLRIGRVAGIQSGCLISDHLLVFLLEEIADFSLVVVEACCNFVQLGVE